MLIANALNKKFTYKKKKFNGFCVLKFLIFKAGKVVKISGLSKIKKFKEVVVIKLLIKSNQKISAPQSGAGRHGFVILNCKNKSEINKIYNKIIKTLQINYD